MHRNTAPVPALPSCSLVDCEVDRIIAVLDCVNKRKQSIVLFIQLHALLRHVLDVPVEQVKSVVKSRCNATCPEGTPRVAGLSRQMFLSCPASGAAFSTAELQFIDLSLSQGAANYRLRL
jgi:hypothetical protein